MHFIHANFTAAGSSAVTYIVKDNIETEVGDKKHGGQKKTESDKVL